MNTLSCTSPIYTPMWHYSLGLSWSFHLTNQLFFILFYLLSQRTRCSSQYPHHHRALKPFPALLLLSFSHYGMIFLHPWFSIRCYNSVGLEFIVSLNSTPPEFFVGSHKQSGVLIKGKWRSKLEILNKRKEPYF